jgi:hypothetical protein
MGYSQVLRIISSQGLVGELENMGTEVLRSRRDAGTGYLPPRLMVQSRNQSPQFLPEILLPSEKAALPGSDVDCF